MPELDGVLYRRRRDEPPEHLHAAAPAPPACAAGCGDGDPRRLRRVQQRRAGADANGTTRASRRVLDERHGEVLWHASSPDGRLRAAAANVVVPKSGSATGGDSGRDGIAFGPQLQEHGIARRQWDGPRRAAPNEHIRSSVSIGHPSPPRTRIMRIPASAEFHRSLPAGDAGPRECGGPLCVECAAVVGHGRLPRATAVSRIAVPAPGGAALVPRRRFRAGPWRRGGGPHRRRSTASPCGSREDSSEEEAHAHRPDHRLSRPRARRGEHVRHRQQRQPERGGGDAERPPIPLPTW